MDEMKNTPAVEAEKIEQAMQNEQNTGAEETALVLKFKKPYVFDHKTYTEVDLSELEQATGEDLAAVGRLMGKIGIVSPMPEMTMDYCQYMAARVAKLPVEFFKGLPARESMRLKNLVTGFLYGGDGDN